VCRSYSDVLSVQFRKTVIVTCSYDPYVVNTSYIRSTIPSRVTHTRGNIIKMYLKKSFVVVDWTELAECRVLSERVPKPASYPVGPGSSSIVRLWSKNGPLVREQSARRVDATHEAPERARNRAMYPPHPPSQGPILEFDTEDSKGIAEDTRRDRSCIRDLVFSAL
jgi:hypothetical protein